MSGATDLGTGGWVADQGTDAIPPDRLGMLPYVGPVPEVDVAAAGFGEPVPQAFMVEMGAESAPLRTHFHVVDQFQVVVHGSGRLGRHDLRPGSLHYADRFTPYGPLAAGPAGLSYLTLRSTSDTGAHYMPDFRDELREQLGASERPPGARRNLSVDVEATVPAGVRDAGVERVRELVADDDGLRLAVLTLPPGTSGTLGAVGGSGAYLVVRAGEVAEGVAGEDERLWGPWSLRWLPPGAAAAVTAGPGGLVAALAQLPRTAF